MSPPPSIPGSYWSFPNLEAVLSCNASSNKYTLTLTRQQATHFFLFPSRGVYLNLSPRYLTCAPHQIFLLLKPLLVILSTPSFLPPKQQTLHSSSLLVLLNKASREPTRWPPSTTPGRRRRPHLHCCWRRRRHLSLTWHHFDRHPHYQVLVSTGCASLSELSALLQRKDQPSPTISGLSRLARPVMGAWCTAFIKTCRPYGLFGSALGILRNKRVNVQGPRLHSCNIKAAFKVGQDFDCKMERSACLTSPFYLRYLSTACTDC
ncbi:hypothetical protein QBC45DRAFT_135413 [Copromyces sp. CBS 386.78]|nr:hypothetical protein QBC45DRAFT_135413 [Copromyces sp. CBS 386.78]